MASGQSTPGRGGDAIQCGWPRGGATSSLRQWPSPEKCDFCGQPYADGRYPVPEEAGAWACSECDARWEKHHDRD